mgnify:CR=1 FL=1
MTTVNFYLLLSWCKHSFTQYETRHSPPWILLDTSCIDTWNIYLKRHGQGKKIRGHNIQLWPLMMIYVCSVWRPSKSSMPVIYQHIFVFSLVNSHNLFSFRTIFSDRALHLNPFRRELVIKQYHKIAFKGSSIPLKNAWKTPNFRPFATINIKINFGLDRSWIYRKWVSNMAWPSSGWSHKVTGDVQGQGKPGADAVAKQCGWALFDVWNN